MSNPFWVSILAATIRKLSRTCPHCGKTGTYTAKKTAEFYRCHFCGQRFQRKEKK